MPVFAVAIACGALIGCVRVESEHAVVAPVPQEAEMGGTLLRGLVDANGNQMWLFKPMQGEMIDVEPGTSAVEFQRLAGRVVSIKGRMISRGGQRVFAVSGVRLIEGKD